MRNGFVAVAVVAALAMAGVGLALPSHASVVFTPFAFNSTVSTSGAFGGVNGIYGNGDVRLDAYTRLDVSASWQLSPRFEAYLAIDNLTDQEYEEFVGFEARGIAPRAGVRFSL